MVIIYKLKSWDFPHGLIQRLHKGPLPLLTPICTFKQLNVSSVSWWKPQGGSARRHPAPAPIISRASPKQMAPAPCRENDTAEELLAQSSHQRIWPWFHFRGNPTCCGSPMSHSHHSTGRVTTGPQGWELGRSGKQFPL